MARRQAHRRVHCQLGRATIESVPIERPTPTRKRPQGLCLDKGYDYAEVRDLCAEFAFTSTSPAA